MTMLSIAFSLFILMDSIGNIPLFLSLLRKVEPERQKKVIVREMIIALFVIILFSFVGDGLMQFLNVENDTIQIAGGIILFLICLRMIFPTGENPDGKYRIEDEPFIVPLAIPLIAGPSVLAAVMIYAKQEASDLVMVGSIVIAWIGSLAVLLAGSFLKEFLGPKILIALERLMGLIMTLIAIQMLMNGIASFIIRQGLLN